MYIRVCCCHLKFIFFYFTFLVLKDGLKTQFHDYKFKMQTKKHKYAVKQAARSEILQTEETG